MTACSHNDPNDAKSKASDGPKFPAIANVAGSKGHTISRESIDQIQTGMSESEVKQILGTPSTESSPGNGSVMMIWYDSHHQCVQVVFDKGKVIQKSYSGQNEEASQFTQTDLDQVKTGMAEAKVLQLLGPSNNDFSTGSTRVLSWENSKLQVMIHFQNGKVANKFVNPK
jgi:outer membrane protein assembly factor BamE (lipoprotein component of BamABCDE complex)